MTFGKWALLAAVALALAGCGGRSQKEMAAASYCPQPLTVQDAQRITRFKPGTGRDPRDVVFEAEMLGVVTQCSMARNKMEVDVVMRIAFDPVEIDAQALSRLAERRIQHVGREPAGSSRMRLHVFSRT